MRHLGVAACRFDALFNKLFWEGLNMSVTEKS